MDQLHKVQEVHHGVPPCSVIVIVVSTNRLHQTQSKQQQLQSGANPQCIRWEPRSTDRVSNTQLLDLAYLLVTCCQHARSLQSHGIPPLVLLAPSRNTPAPPYSAGWCIASGSQRLCWFCLQVSKTNRSWERKKVVPCNEKRDQILSS